MRTHHFALALLTALIISPAFAAQPSTRPATKPATATKSAIDRSSPEKTWTALCNSVKAGDLAAFRACYYNKNEICSLFMNSYSDTVITSFQLANAVTPMGADGIAMAKTLQAEYNDMVKSGQNRKTTITGDTAKWVQTLTSEKVVAEQTMYFKKVGNDWLIDTEQSLNLNTAEGRKGAEDFIASAEPTVKALKTVIADIQAKRITTVAQVRARMSIKP
jgi:hypothetical protein